MKRVITDVHVDIAHYSHETKSLGCLWVHRDSSLPPEQMSCHAYNITARRYGRALKLQRALIRKITRERAAK